MKVEKEQLGTSQWLLTVEVPADVVNEELEIELKKLQQQAVMPGFRKGKIPHRLIRKQYEKELKIDILHKHLGEYYEQALKEADIGTPVAAPRIDIVQFDIESALIFKATVDTEPPIELAPLDSLTVVRENAEITDEAVDIELENLRQRQAVIQEDTEPAGLASLLEVELQELDAGYIPIIGRKRQDVTIDLSRSTAEIRDSLVGIRPGEKRNVTLVRPPGSPNEEKKYEYIQVVAKSVKRKDLPELNDDFAKEVGSELQDLQSLRQAVKTELQRQVESLSYQRMVHLLAHQIVDNTRLEVPQSMLDDYLDRMVEDTRKNLKNDQKNQFDEKFVRDQYRERVSWNLRWYLIRKRLIEIEGFKIEEEDFQREYERIAAGTGKKLKLVQAYYSTEKERSRLEDDLLERKVLQFIVGKARVIDRTVSFADFFARAEEEHRH
ncbi:MAG: trigger factor [bacterium]|nr:trigger factor [bacterium]